MERKRKRKREREREIERLYISGLVPHPFSAGVAASRVVGVPRRQSQDTSLHLHGLKREPLKSCSLVERDQLTQQRPNILNKFLHFWRLKHKKKFL